MADVTRVEGDVAFEMVGSQFAEISKVRAVSQLPWPVGAHFMVYVVIVAMLDDVGSVLQQREATRSGPSRRRPRWLTAPALAAVAPTWWAVLGLNQWPLRCQGVGSPVAIAKNALRPAAPPSRSPPITLLLPAVL
jgi:hypothetical protein